ncbi:AbrB family transcriptional regulator [Tetragenococcus halophilus]|nr:AbrB family transcriptional regulator [Tetragenococcus halophilus]
MSLGISIFFTFIVALIGAKLGRKLNFPAPFMIGSMLAVMLFSIITNKAYFPQEYQGHRSNRCGNFYRSKIDSF